MSNRLPQVKANDVVHVAIKLGFKFDRQSRKSCNLLPKVG